MMNWDGWARQPLGNLLKSSYDMYLRNKFHAVNEQVILNTPFLLLACECIIGNWSLSAGHKLTIFNYVRWTPVYLEIYKCISFMLINFTFQLEKHLPAQGRMLHIYTLFSIYLFLSVSRVSTRAKCSAYFKKTHNLTNTQNAIGVLRESIIHYTWVWL